MRRFTAQQGDRIKSSRGTRSFTTWSLSATWTLVSLILCANVASAQTKSQDAAPPALTVERMIVVLIDESSVPATITGPLTELSVREGTAVKRDQIVAQIDERRSRLNRDLAQRELQIAKTRLTADVTRDLAAKAVEMREHESAQHQRAFVLIEKQAKNRLRVDAASKAADVARNQHKRAVAARERFTDSVSEAEIESLLLAAERAKLDTAQAEFEHESDQLTVTIESGKQAGFDLAIEKAEIDLGESKASQQVLEIQAQAAQLRLELAELDLQQHVVRSPINGVVAERLAHAGEWVTAGTPLVRLIRLDRLRAEGFVSADLIDQLRQHRTVTLTTDRTLTAETLTADGTQTDVDRSVDAMTDSLTGTITFINPEIDPINHEVQFWVDFDNPGLRILPGMKLTMRTQTDDPADAGGDNEQ